MGRQTERFETVVTRIASGTVDARRFIRQNGKQCDGAGQKAMGVSMDCAVNGQTFPVAIDGTALVEAGAGIPSDVEVTTDANGRAVRATRGQIVNGRSLGSVSGLGQDVEVFLCTGISVYTTTTTSSTTSTTSTTSSTTSTTSTTTTAP